MLADGRYDGLNSPEIVDGMLPLSGIPTRSRFLLDTRKIRIDDPFLVPVEEAYTLYTHPGSELAIEIRFQPIGDIEGYIIGSHNGEGIAGVAVELLGQNGKTLFATESEFDGYFTFASIPIGSYIVRVTGSSGETHHDQDVELESEDGYLLLDDVVY